MTRLCAALMTAAATFFTPFCGPGAGAAPPTRAVEVAVSHARNAEGHLFIALFDDRTAWEQFAVERAAASAVIPAATPARVTFHDLPAGSYAVFAFHDENSNGDLDLRGDLPLEGYAVSGARDRFDEPSFDRAATDSPRIDLRLYYLN